jgi:hypothetical protein
MVVLMPYRFFDCRRRPTVVPFTSLTSLTPVPVHGGTGGMRKAKGES